MKTRGEYCIEISKRLRKARTGAGYFSVRAFSKKFNIPESTYSQHETGSRMMNIYTLLYYSDLLKIDACWLLTGREKL